MISQLFHRNPRLAILAIFLIIAGGLGGLFTLPRQEDPTLSERFALVVTEYPGASAERVEALVTAPIESAIRELHEVRELDSTSRNGVSVITVELKEAYRKDKVEPVWTRVREKLGKAEQFLPKEAGIPDLRRQHIGADTLIMSFSMDQGFEDNIDLIARLARELQLKFQNLTGTQETKIYGVPDAEIRIDVNPNALSRLGMNVGQLAQTVSAADAKLPAGRVTAQNTQLSMEVAGEFTGMDKVARVPLGAGVHGLQTRLGDIATITKTHTQPVTKMAFRDGKRVILVSAHIAPNQRVDLWTDKALNIVEEFRANLPDTVHLNVVFKQNDYVDARLHGLFRNLLLSALLVFGVSFLVMGWRAAIIVGSALPLTVFMVLSLFKFMGTPLHQMSVTGIVIALGLLIDTAIVMVDEYELMRHRGAGSYEAIKKTVRHLLAPLLASTVTTMLAFAPISLMPGASGEFVGWMGTSVIFSVGASFLLAFTLIPAFAAWFDREPLPGEKVYFWTQGIRIPALGRMYHDFLGWVIANPWKGILVSVLVPLAGFIGATTLPMQFFPPVDRDMFQVQLVMPADATLQATRERVQQIEDRIMQEKGIKHITWVMGEGAPKVFYNVFSSMDVTTNIANGFVRTDSSHTTHRLVGKLQHDLRNLVPDGRVLALPFEQGPPVQAPIEFYLYGDDFQVLDHLASQLRNVLSTTPGVTYTMSVLETGEKVAQLQADESATLRAGLTLNGLAGQMNALSRGVDAGSVQEGLERVPVRVHINPQSRQTLAEAESWPIPLAGGAGTVTPGNFGPMKLVPKVAGIPHKDTERYTAVQASLEPYLLASEVQAEFERRLAATDFHLPPGYRLQIGGEAEGRAEAMGNLFSTAVPLLILMIGAIVLSFNSFSYAGIVGASGFLSVGLALFSIFIFGQSTGFMAIVGIMGLVGLAINGTIVVLSALKANEKAKIGDAEEVRHTVMDATRHIVATTLTTIAGFIPLLMFGDSFWGPLATAIAGGVAGAAVLALVFAPSAFVLLARWRLHHKEKLAYLKARKLAALEKAMAVFSGNSGKSGT